MKVIEIIPKFPQWEDIEYAPDFVCPECGKSGVGSAAENKMNLIGWCETYNGYMAILECPLCHTKYRFHPHLTWFDLDEFDFYLGAYYIGLNGLGWAANAEELRAKLKSDKKQAVKI